jgi:hypothetical protein
MLPSSCVLPLEKSLSTHSKHLMIMTAGEQRLSVAKLCYWPPELSIWPLQDVAVDGHRRKILQTTISRRKEHKSAKSGSLTRALNLLAKYQYLISTSDDDNYQHIIQLTMIFLNQVTGKNSASKSTVRVWTSSSQYFAECWCKQHSPIWNQSKTLVFSCQNGAGHFLIFPALKCLDTFTCLILKDERTCHSVTFFHQYFVTATGRLYVSKHKSNKLTPDGSCRGCEFKHWMERELILFSFLSALKRDIRWKSWDVVGTF